jgi:hypothetical protein
LPLHRLLHRLLLLLKLRHAPNSTVSELCANTSWRLKTLTWFV